MMYYIERGVGGAIIALFGQPQEGRTDPEPLAADDPEVVAFFNPPPSLEDYRAAIRAHVDVTAQSRQYDNAVSCASYATSTNPVWAAEAAAFVAWRDAVWTYSFAELAKVENGERAAPTVEVFVAELVDAVPMVWPS